MASLKAIARLAGGGGGTIGGSIAATQVAFGSGANTITGSADLTFGANQFLVNGSVFINGVTAGLQLLAVAGVTYPDSLLFVDDAGFVNIGDAAGDVNNTFITVDDGSATISIYANNGVNANGVSIDNGGNAIGTTFNGLLATANISQFTNNSGYITSSTGLFVNNATNGTLTRSGSGPYTLGLNLANANTWTGQQTFNTSTAIFGVAPTFSTMTPGSILFAGTAGLLTQDNANLFWDDTNNRLGINKSAAPVATFDVNGNSLSDVEAFNLSTTSIQSLIPIMTSNISPKGVASCTGGLSNAYTLFNGDLLTNFKFSTGSLPLFFEYQFTGPEVINSYQYWYRGGIPSRTPNTWIFEGSNNGSSWTTLDTQTGVTTATWNAQYSFSLRFSFSNSTPYLYYRMNISVANDTLIDPIALKMYGPALTPGLVTDSLGRSGFGTPTPAQTIDIQSSNLGFSVVEPPSPLTCSLAGAGAGNIDNGDHRYSVIFVNNNGHTNTSNWSNTITVVNNTTNGKMALTNIATSGDPSVTSRIVARTKAGDPNNAYFLTTIADNTTTTFTDNIADSGLGYLIGSPLSDPWQQDSYQNTTTGRIYIGSNPLLHFAGGGNNLYFGTRVGNLPMTGGPNVAFGAQLMRAVTTGFNNCAFGVNCMLPLTTGQSNMAIGSATLVNLTIGNNNCAVGAGALVNITDGTQNVGISTSAGQTNVNGNNNTYIGYQADALGSNYSQSTALGMFAKIGASNTMVLGGAIGTACDVNIISGASVASAKLHMIAVTEQLRLGYDVSNYFSTTINSTGSATFALTGTSPVFTFSQNMVVPDMKAATYHVGSDAGIDATVTYLDTVLGAKVLTFKKGILTAQT